ncbi:MAG: pilus assembly protein TadG-related protein [Ignavibacteriales bacterium]
MNRLVRPLGNENGQSLVLMALLIVVLMGFAALVVDVGAISLAKTRLQNAADAAAAAGAQQLPDASAATEVAYYYADQNGIPEEDTTVTTSFNGDPNVIEVVCEKQVNYAFATVLGFTGKRLSARSVASFESEWAGDALPFINLDDDYQTNPEIVAWEKTSPGDFESIDNYEIVNPGDPDRLYFKIDYMNGVELKKGTVATIKQEVGYIFDRNYRNKPVYLISLNRSVMSRGTVLLKCGGYRSLSKLKNNDVVDPSQLVLLECIFHDYDYSGKTLYLTVQDVYDIANGELPPDYVCPDGGTSKLLE